MSTIPVRCHLLLSRLSFQGLGHAQVLLFRRAFLSLRVFQVWQALREGSHHPNYKGKDLNYSMTCSTRARNVANHGGICAENISCFLAEEIAREITTSSAVCLQSSLLMRQNWETDGKYLITLRAVPVSWLPFHFQDLQWRPSVSISKQKHWFSILAKWKWLSNTKVVLCDYVVRLVRHVHRNLFCMKWEANL